MGLVIFATLFHLDYNLLDRGPAFVSDSRLSTTTQFRALLTTYTAYLFEGITLSRMAPATPQKAKTAFQAELSLQPLKNCLVNLPAPLAAMLEKNNMVSFGIV